MQKKKTPIVIANWKSNIPSYKKAISLAGSVGVQRQGAVVGICPSHPHLYPVWETMDRRKVLLGAQDVSLHQTGNHTGEVTAEVLKNLGVSFVILGHIERRSMGDTDEDIKKKVKVCLANKITPLICVGEIDPKEKTVVLKRQVLSAIDGLSKAAVSRIMFAYEPVSFIGKGEASNEEDIFRSILFIRSVVSKKLDKTTAFSFPVLYGGSVSSNNVKKIFENTNVDGFLIGTASLKAGLFNSVVKTLC